MEIKRFISPLLDENCYALILGGEIAIIDPGMATPELLAFAKDNIQKIKYILLTHRHFDHILGTYDLVMLCPNVKVAVHNLEKDCLLSDSFSLADQIGISANQTLNADILLEDGDSLTLGDKNIKVINTPGHTKGSVCFIVEDAIFSGDTLFKNSVGRTDFESGSYSDMLNSLITLKNLDGDYNIYPGHGDFTTLKAEKNTNPYMR